MTESDDVQLIREYLSGRLDEAAQDSFETRMLEDPLFCEEFQIEQTIREGMRELRTQPSTSKPVESGPGIVERVMLLVATPGWSLSATAMAVLLLAVTNLPHSVGLLPVNGMVILEQTRGIDEVIELPPVPVVLQVDAFPFSNGDAKITLLRQDTVVLEFDNLGANHDGFYRLLLADQPGGKYSLIVEADQKSLSYTLIVPE